MKDLTDRLAAIGAPISKDDQVVTLLGSLEGNFATLVTALVSRANVVTLDFVQLALKHEEMKQTETFRRSSEATKKSKGHKARVAGSQDRRQDSDTESEDSGAGAFTASFGGVELLDKECR